MSASINLFDGEELMKRTSPSPIRKKKTHGIVRIFLVLSFVLSLFGVVSLVSAKQPKSSASKHKTSPRKKTKLSHRRLKRFSSNKEFRAYILRLKSLYKSRRRRYRSRRRKRSIGGLLGAPTKSLSAPPTPSSASSKTSGGTRNDKITNNQIQGVDEGDIVKVIGRYLVILRRGRLFSVRIEDGKKTTLLPVGRADAQAPNLKRGGWYDEMLVYKRRIVVIGYNYNHSSTEINLFRLGKRGKLHFQTSHFLRSNDYYSSRNYASRLIGSKLVFYMPFRLRYQYHSSYKLPMPSVARFGVRKNGLRWKKILFPTRIYRPVQFTLNPTLHTVVQCNLARRNLRCSARAVIGSSSRTFFVSRDSVYIWAGADYIPWWAPSYMRKRKRDAFLYRMSLHSSRVSAVRVHGQPIDQFSFHDSGDGHLNFLLSSRSGGDWMWSAERAKGKLAFLRFPKRYFSSRAGIIGKKRYTPIPGPKYGSIHNRFIGRQLYWGGGQGWYARRHGHQNKAWLLDIKKPKTVNTLQLKHSVERIEAMGRNAVLIGHAGRSLHFTSFGSGVNPTPQGHYEIKNASQGETRSHGFFFLPGKHNKGLLGLPVRRRAGGSRQLRHGSAGVVFLRVDADLHFHSLGSLQAKNKRVNDACRFSCVDWYGNARPIFMRGRIFALLGYELVEGTLMKKAIKEKTRTTYFLNAPAQIARD
ncbi:MAG TPA: hypothetical protein DCE42_21020 [Myxococcales bacterium]|nr:hypothetical protein [Myxococcales bacterium]